MQKLIIDHFTNLLTIKNFDIMFKRRFKRSYAAPAVNAPVTKKK